MYGRVSSRSKTIVSARVMRDGRVVDLGRITSPFDDPIRNWCWKKWRSFQIRRALR